MKHVVVRVTASVISLIHVLIYIAGIVYVEAYSKHSFKDFGISNAARYFIFTKLVLLVIFWFLFCWEYKKFIAISFYFAFTLDFVASVTILIIFLVSENGVEYEYVLSYFIIQNVGMMLIDILGMISCCLSFQSISAIKPSQPKSSIEEKRIISRLTSYGDIDETRANEMNAGRMKNNPSRTRSNRNVIIKLSSPRNEKIKIPVRKDSLPMNKQQNNAVNPKKFDMPSYLLERTNESEIPNSPDNSHRNIFYLSDSDSSVKHKDSRSEDSFESIESESMVFPKKSNEENVVDDVIVDLESEKINEIYEEDNKNIKNIENSRSDGNGYYKFHNNKGSLSRLDILKSIKTQAHESFC